MAILGPIAFVFAFFGAMPMAGPVGLLILSNAVQGRFGVSMRIAVGGAAGEVFYSFIAFFGFTTLFARHPMIIPVCRGLACLLLVPMGLHFARWDNPPQQDLDDTQNRRGTFAWGFIGTLINPSILASWSAAVAALYSTGWVHVSEWGAIPFGAGAGVGNFAWSLVVLGVLKKYREHFRREVLTWTVRVMGMVLVGVGILAGVEFVLWIQQDRQKQHQSQSLIEMPRRPESVLEREARPRLS
jgi:threonine/homoserine/homoserine lactone efflux protein